MTRDDRVIITPLGTISPYCKGKRNCPGFLVNYKGQRILLDIGNGITRYLNFPTDLKNLHAFVTHGHIDHYGDSGLVQYASYVNHKMGLLDEEVNFYLPEEIYSEVASLPEAHAKYTLIRNDAVYIIDDLKITVHDNKSHTIPAFMIKVESDWFKIVYTGDIGNTNIGDLISFAENADLLINESSLIKAHNVNSTTHFHAYEAAEVAKQACVKKLVLTHFWPETKPKLYREEARKIFKNTVVAQEGKQLVLKKGGGLCDRFTYALQLFRW